MQVESEDVRMDARYEYMLEFAGEQELMPHFRMLRDDRLRGEFERTIFDVKEAPDKLG